MQYKHPEFDESINVTKSNPLAQFAGYLGTIFAAIAIIYVVSAMAVELVVPHVGIETEQWIWQKVLKDEYVKASNTIDTKLQKQEKYLQQLLDSISKKDISQRSYDVILVEDEDTNAMALPSGKIVVFTGLLKHMKSENAIVFVLGHELGHFANRDHLRGMGRALLASVVLAPIFAWDSDSGYLISIIGSGFSNHFSRDQERAADEYGLKVLTEKYGHAGGAVEFFDYLEKTQNEPKLLRYMSTHPLSSDRITHLQNIIAAKSIKTLPTVPKKF